MVWGAALPQKQSDGVFKSVAFASRLVNSAQRRSALIEGARCWGCDNFSKRIIGKNFTIKTDHKSLQQL